MELLIYNHLFLRYLKLFCWCMESGKRVPPDAIANALTCGRRAEVPDEFLNLLEAVNHHGATIH